MNQEKIDTLSESFRSQGLTWGQTNFAVSVVRNSVEAENAAKDERIAELEAEWSRECNDADKIIDKLGLTIEKARTDGGSLKVTFICTHIQETIDALADADARRIYLFNENAAKARRIAELEQQSVSGFWEEEHPQFKQGQPTHELESVVTADECTNLVGHILSGKQQIAALTAENEKLRKDAERYRFIRDIDPDAGDPFIVVQTQDSWGNWKDRHLEGEDADAAIDTALAKLREPT